MKGIQGLYNVGKNPTWEALSQERAGVGFLLLLAVIIGIESSSTSTFNKNSHQLGRISVMITRGHCGSI